MPKAFQDRATDKWAEIRADSGALAMAALIACGRLDTLRSIRYADFVMSSLSEATRRALETMMSLHKYEYQSEFAKRYFAQGQAEAMRKILLGLLTQRFQHIPDTVKERIEQAERARAALIHNDLMRLKVEEKLAKRQGRDLLREMSEQMEEEYWERVAHLEALRRT